MLAVSPSALADGDGNGTNLIASKNQTPRGRRDIQGRQPAEPPGPQLVEVLPLDDRIVMLHFDEGHVVHHRRGMPRSDERVVASPLELTAAARATNYRITSSDDPAYAGPRAPDSVGRKSKGTDFAWFVNRWENGHAVNTRPDHAKEHWLYLHLPSPMLRGKSYTVDTGRLAANGRRWTLKFDEAKSRSEAVHVNLIGYRPMATQKFAYVYQWMGDQGSLDLRPHSGRPFHLIDEATGRTVFTGKLMFRAPSTQQETFHKTDSPPDGNFLKADVYDCDFSSFATPGRYRVSVEGIGASFPFRLDVNVYREAFRTVARGLYHNRSGIALEAAFTEFTRPAPHNPKLTPGFAGKLIYTTVRYPEWGSEGGNAKELLAHAKGPIESAGWYQDAGDWDSYETHLRVAQELLLAYELAPKNFRDGELNIPESRNGVPDILDEAAWLPRFCQRLRHELLRKGYGTGGIGLRIAGDAFGDDEKTLPDGKKVGQGSWEDVHRTWAASGEDPWSTYRYAGAAAQLADALSLARVADPEGIDWTAEAKDAYAWARKNTRPGDAARQPSLKVPRAYASAALFRLTGDKTYEARFLEDTSDITSTSGVWDEGQYGPELYALASGKGKPDAASLERIRSAILFTADSIVGGCGGQTGPSLGRQLVHADAGGPADDADGAPAGRRRCARETVGPGAGEALPRHPRNDVRLLPWLQRAQHDLGDRPGPAASGRGLSHGRLVQRQRALPSGHHPLRSLAQGS